MLTLKWVRDKLKQDIQEVKVIQKEQQGAISELEKLNQQLKAITTKK